MRLKGAMLKQIGNADFPGNPPVEPTADGGKSSLRASTLQLWAFAALFGLMFIGMTHNLFSYDATQEESYEDIVEGSDTLEKDASAVPVERKASFVLSALLAAYCWGARRRSLRFGSAPLGMMLLAIVLLAFASLLWTESFKGTAINLVRFTVYGMLALGIVLRFTPSEITKILVLSSALSLAVAVGYGFVGYGVGSFFDVPRLKSSLHPNIAARFATIVIVGALALLWNKSRSNWFFIVLIVFSAVALLLTRSRTSLACCVAGVFTIYFVSMTWRQRLLFASLGAITLGGFLLAAGVTGDHMLQDASNVANMGRGEDSDSLNGRLPLWDELLRMSRERRMQGFGYGVFWNSKRNTKLLHTLDWAPGHSHNLFIESMLDFGLIGAVLIVAIGWGSLLRLGVMAHRTGDPGFRALFAICTVIISNSFTTSSFIQPRELAVISGVVAFSAALAPWVDRPLPARHTRREQLSTSKLLRAAT